MENVKSNCSNHGLSPCQQEGERNKYSFGGLLPNELDLLEDCFRQLWVLAKWDCDHYHLNYPALVQALEDEHTPIKAEYRGVDLVAMRKVINQMGLNPLSAVVEHIIKRLGHSIFLYDIDNKEIERLSI